MKLYNSRTRKIETFVPLHDNEVKMYVCGITPDGPTHLGHAFTYVFFDVLYRYLRYKGYHITYTQNLTDVDNEILIRAKAAGEPWRLFQEKWSTQFLKDIKALNILMPDHYVKASETIDHIIEMVQTLLKKGMAYVVDGDVYFDYKKFPAYGQLSCYTEDQMVILAAERGGVINNPEQKHPLDFFLWQKSTKDEPRWPSPWGWGRPGWHIECSAMSNCYLGPQLDIHGGGHDLIFPHHESEIAQSESYTGKKPFVNFWIHTSMLMYEGEKMSKSLGNLILVSDLLKKYSANAIRYVLLSHCYRDPWEFHEDELIEAERRVHKVYKVLKVHKEERALESFEKLMDNDIKTHEVLKLVEDKPSKKVLEILGFNPIHLPSGTKNSTWLGSPYLL